MRVVAHVDMDAFFASVEERLNPGLAGKPLIVGGGLERRGVVSSANYAARPFGIHAGMPIAEARRLCPQAVFLEGDPRKYVHVSLQILETLKDFTPVVEPFSIDEAFLDLTAVLPRPVESLDTAIPKARAMQRSIRRRVGLTASIGIGPNKYIAKMASGLEKPSGLTVLSVDRYRQVFAPRGVDSLWGIGEKTRTALETLGIRTVGQLARFPRELLTYHFGLNGDRMREAARGEDETSVTPYYEGVPVKSMGHEFTLPEDEHRPEGIASLLLRLCDQLGRRLRQEGYLGRVVAVKFRDASFRTVIRQHAIAEVTDDDHAIYRAASELLARHWDGRPLRLVGVSVSGLVAAAGYYQHRMFEVDEHRRKMIETVDALRNRFGDEALVKAGTLP